MVDEVFKEPKIEYGNSSLDISDEIVEKIEEPESEVFRKPKKSRKVKISGYRVDSNGRFVLYRQGRKVIKKYE